jgi:PadR family transcriptional regulator, regulatory protein PadR
MAQNIEEFQKKFNKELKTGLLSMLALLAVDKDPDPSYGYRIIKDLETASGGKFTFPEGTVYPILSQLSEMGYLKAYWGEPTEGPRRKYYQITKDGKAALAMCLEEWNSTSRIVANILSTLSKGTDRKKKGDIQ